MYLGLNLGSLETDEGFFVPGTVPKVKESVTHATGDGIMVVFDRPMAMTTNIKDALSVIINGGTPIHPDKVLFNTEHDFIGMIFPIHTFKVNDVITWSYNDQHPTEEIKGAETGGKEIDNQTYTVKNELSEVPIVLLSEVYANNDKRIVVEWDRAMKADADIRFDIDIVIDGAAAILAETVIFSEVSGKHYMMLVMTLPVVAGQLLTWNYDTTGGSLSSVVGDFQAEGHMHPVDNKLAAAPGASLPRPDAGDIDTSADINGVTLTGTFIDFIVTQGNNSDQTERGYKDPKTGASTGAFGAIDKTTIESGIEIFGVYARIYPRVGNKVSLDLEVVLKKDDSKITKIFMKIGNKMYPLTYYTGGKYVVNSVEGFDLFNHSHPTINVGLQLVKTPPPPPDPGDGALDLDGEGNPDTVIYDANDILITEDADSFDIDLDGDGIADISIHK